MVTENINDKIRRLLITIIILGIIALGMSGCATLKKTKEAETKITETETVKEDSKTETTINKPIEDRIVIVPPQTDNKELFSMFETMMKQLNTSKTSGDNSYRSRYDEDLKQWIIDFTVAQTENKKSDVIKDTKTEKTFEQNVNEYIKKIVIPWWIYVLAIFLAWPTIKRVLNIFAALIPGLAFLKPILNKNNEPP